MQRLVTFIKLMRVNPTLSTSPMKNKLLCALLALSTLTGLSSCGPSLRSESGLYNVKLERSIKADVDGFWISSQPNPYAKQRSGLIYIAPLDIRVVRAKFPDMAGPLATQMHGHMIDKMASSIAKMNKESHLSWNITSDRSKADISIELAVVKFSPQNSHLKVLNAVGGWFIPVPGVSTAIGSFAAGNIVVEGVFRDARRGTVMAAFKDSNRATTRLYDKNAYKDLGHADKNMQHWAERIANVIYVTHFDESGRVTLRDDIKNRSVSDVIKLKASDQL